MTATKNGTAKHIVMRFEFTSLGRAMEFEDQLRRMSLPVKPREYKNGVWYVVTDTRALAQADTLYRFVYGTAPTTKAEPPKPKISYAALSTILAALRAFQGMSLEDQKSMYHFADCEPLTDEEIDDLCEEINCGMFDIEDGPEAADESDDDEEDGDDE